MRKTLSAVVIATGLAVVPLLALAQQGEEEAPTLEELVSTMAHTPEAHQALANFFRDKARKARAEEHVHRRMSSSPGNGKPPEIQRIREHCDRIVKAQASLAKEYEGLARVHDEMAKSETLKP